MKNDPLLIDVKNISINFSGIKALDNVSLKVNEGEVVGLIGPNGSGKTTLFNCISRIYQPTSGEIYLSGNNLLSVKLTNVIKYGMARTFQNLALFHSLNVVENILLGAHIHTRSGFIANILRLPYVKREEKFYFYQAMQLLEEFSMQDLAKTKIFNLPYATQKRVELIRALISKPKIILLDEPAGGLNHHEVDELGVFLLELKKKTNMSLFIVEHHLSFVMKLSSKVFALESGKLIAEGTPEEVQNNEKVKRAYLGN